MFLIKPDNGDLHIDYFNCNNHRICILIIIFVLLVVFNLSIFHIKLNNYNKIKNKKY